MIFSTIVLIRLWAILNHTFLWVLSSKFYVKIFENRTQACWMRSANAASALCGCLPLHWFFSHKNRSIETKIWDKLFSSFFFKMATFKKFSRQKKSSQEKKKCRSPETEESCFVMLEVFLVLLLGQDNRDLMHRWLCIAQRKSLRFSSSEPAFESLFCSLVIEQ